MSVMFLARLVNSGGKFEHYEENSRLMLSNETSELNALLSGSRAASVKFSQLAYSVKGSHNMLTRKNRSQYFSKS